LINDDASRNPYTRFRSGIVSATSSNVNAETVLIDRVYTAATELGPLEEDPPPDPDPDPPASVSVSSTRPDDRLSIALTHADGRITRLGPDETDAAFIPQDLTFSTKIPGGFDTASLGLLRRIDVDWPDLGLFDNVRIVGPGGRVAWEGRQMQFPRSHGDSFGITPGAVGWASHLRDDPTFAEVFIGRDLSQWEGPGLDRRTDLAAGAITAGGQSALDGGHMLSYQGEWASTNGFSAEMYYRAPPGRGISRIGADWSVNATVGTNATFTLRAYSTEDQATFPESSSDVLTGALSGTLNYTPGTPRRMIGVHFGFPIAGGVAGADYAAFLQNLYVVGEHDLQIHGSTAATGGVLGYEVVAYIVRTAAPLLTYSVGADGSIEPTSHVISHLVYRDPITAEQAITDVNKFDLYDWGVWENREFFYRQPDPDRMCWEARLGDGAHMTADGLTGEHVSNGVAVSYTDATGQPKTVGPPGGNFDDTSADLQDSSVENPANAAGLPAKWDMLPISFPISLGDAIKIGSVYLAERSLATRRGSVTLTGTVRHPTEGPVPVWRVRAGDWVRVTDLNGENATVQRKVIATSYTHSSRQITLELDNTPAKLSAILERVGISTGIAMGSGF
jgi:hypothetical protein